VSQRIALERLSVEDNLTQMYNRRGFIDFFDNYLVVRINHIKTASIIMLDLDFFKRINDTYGHIAGDETLRHVGKILLSFEDEDTKAGRLGGEEFALVLFNKDLKFVEETAEKIRKNIADLSIIVDNSTIRLTTSVGATFSDYNNLSEYSQLYYEADHALYRAKSNGRNRVEIFGTYN
jgi:diguanylate cyclase (GGDEF)-like protein